MQNLPITWQLLHCFRTTLCVPQGPWKNKTNNKKWLRCNYVHIWKVCKFIPSFHLYINWKRSKKRESSFVRVCIVTQWVGTVSFREPPELSMTTLISLKFLFFSLLGLSTFAFTVFSLLHYCFAVLYVSCLELGWCKVYTLIILFINMRNSTVLASLF